MTGRSPEAPRDAGREWVCLGVITKPKGVRGQVRITSFTARPDDLIAYGPLYDRPGGRVMEVTLREILKGGVVVAAIGGIADRDQAEALRGVKLHVPRAALPDAEGGEYYHADLIGLEVVGEDGVAIGSVGALHNFGAGDILEVVRHDDESLMLPFSRDVVPEIDLERGRIVVAPMPETGADEDEP